MSKLEIVEDLDRFAGLVDGDEDLVDISIAETFNGERIDDTQIKINIAHGDDSRGANPNG